MAKNYRELSPKDIEELTEIYQRRFQGETIVSICKELGVDRRTYYRKKEHPQWKKIEKELTDKLIDNAYDEIMQTVVQKAIGGSHNFAKLYMDVTGKIKLTREVREDYENRRNAGSTSPMDLEQLRALVEQDKIRRIK
ncbi:phBC6A51 family helix-turn-helix protein [Virgibacillus siamensis]|uniref:phBC6A51 family helix-turn-helix protein n=1 Tax=Virgibacillus siamensis TaxID=480071 RepID=UPI0009873B6D|nr:phBC6A51 family helix-turn-helix protein [Virgibacillus siamensis]